MAAVIWRDTHDDDPGGQGPVVLLTPEEGWMVGGEHDDDLHVTRDGAKSWQTISLPAPKEISPAKFSTADVPVFEDSKHGFVAVTYAGGHQSAAVLFATDDGGRSWKPDRVLSEPGGNVRGPRSTVRHRRRHLAHRQSLRPSTDPHRSARRRQDACDYRSRFTLVELFRSRSTELRHSAPGLGTSRRRIALDHRRRRHLDRHHSEVIGDSSFFESVAFFGRSKYTTAFRCPGLSSS